MSIIYNAPHQPDPHVCNPPDDSRYSAGTMWACDGCKNVYTLSKIKYNGRIYNHWYKAFFPGRLRKKYGLQ